MNRNSVEVSSYCRLKSLDPNDILILFLVYLHLSIVFLALVTANAHAHCPTTTLVSSVPPKCLNYPNGYFINDFSNCQAYYFCPNILSPPYPGKCLVPYNFDQTRQMCNHPDNYACPSIQCVAEAGKFDVLPFSSSLLN